MLLAQCSDCLFCAASVLGHLRQATGPRGAGGRKAPKSQAPQHPSPAKPARARNQRTTKTKTDKDRLGLLQRKLIIEPHFAGRKSLL
jgi:hypothetical protein